MVVCECGASVEQQNLEKHKETDCGKRMILCSYCELEIEMANLKEHEGYCGSRTEQCEICNQYVQLQDLLLHEQSSCEYPIKKEPQKRKLDSEEQIDLYRLQAMNLYNPGNYSSSTAPEDLIPCDLCTQLIPFAKFSEHQIQCNMDLTDSTSRAIDRFSKGFGSTRHRGATHPLFQEMRQQKKKKKNSFSPPPKEQRRPRVSPQQRPQKPHIQQKRKDSVPRLSKTTKKNPYPPIDLSDSPFQNNKLEVVGSSSSTTTLLPKIENSIATTTTTVTTTARPTGASSSTTTTTTTMKNNHKEKNNLPFQQRRPHQRKPKPPPNMIVVDVDQLKSPTTVSGPSNRGSRKKQPDPTQSPRNQK